VVSKTANVPTIDIGKKSNEPTGTDNETCGRWFEINRSESCKECKIDWIGGKMDLDSFESRLGQWSNISGSDMEVKARDSWDGLKESSSLELE